MKKCKTRSYLFMFTLLFISLLAFSSNEIRANAAGKCTVVLNPNNGSSASRSLATKRGTYGSILYTPSKNGYSFAGWYTSVSGGTRVYNSSRVPNSNIQYLYAHWTPKKMTVTMELGYGSARSQKTVTYGCAYGSLGTPSRTGYEFKGWYTSANGGSRVTQNSTVYRTSNHTIFAHWTRQVCTINLQPRNGSQPTQVKINYGDKYRGLYTPAKTGYNFQGWYTKTSSDGKRRTTKNTVTSSHALYAHWKAKTVQVTFDWNNELRPTTVKRSVSYDGKYGELPSSPLAGYKFLGWYTQKSGGSRVYANTTMTKANDHKIFARWEELPYEVTLNAAFNKGSINGAGCIKKMVFFNKQYGALGTAVRTGYDFLGWYTAKTGGTKIEATTLVRTAQIHTLYAHFTPKDVQVDFNLNYPTGGSAGISLPSKKVKYDGTYGMLTNPPSIKGYTFKGWYSALNGGNRITANTVVKNLNRHNLFARWEPITVTVDLKSEKSTSTTIQVVYGKTYGDKLPSNPPNPGYKFKGWYDDQGNKIDKNSIVSKTVRHDLTAKWEKVRLNVETGFEGYTLCFKMNGEVDAIGSPNIVGSGYNSAYKFKVTSDGAWKASSTLSTVEFRVGEDGQWAKSVSGVGEKLLYIRCKKHERVDSDSREDKGTITITTNVISIKAFAKQVTPGKIEVLIDTDVKERAQKKYPFIPDELFESDCTTGGWKKHDANTFYLVITQSIIDEETAKNILSSYVYVVYLDNGDYCLEQVTPKGRILDAKDMASYKLTDLQKNIIDLCGKGLITKLSPQKIRLLIEAVDEFMEVPNKVKDCLKAADAVYDLKNECYLIMSGEKDGQEDMIYNLSQNTYVTLSSLVNVVDEDMGWIMDCAQGGVEGLINKISRQKAFDEYEAEIRSRMGINVWVDLHKKTTVRPIWWK